MPEKPMEERVSKKQKKKKKKKKNEEMQNVTLINEHIFKENGKVGILIGQKATKSSCQMCEGKNERLITRSCR